MLNLKWQRQSLLSTQTGCKWSNILKSLNSWFVLNLLYKPKASMAISLVLYTVFVENSRIEYSSLLMILWLFLKGVVEFFFLVFCTPHSELCFLCFSMSDLWVNRLPLRLPSRRLMQTYTVSGSARLPQDTRPWSQSSSRNCGSSTGQISWSYVEASSHHRYLWL